MKIVNLMIDDVNNMLADKNLHIEVINNVEEKLVDMGFDPKMVLSSSSGNPRTNRRPDY